MQPSPLVQELQGLDPSPDHSAQMENGSLATLEAFPPPSALPLENVILSCLIRFAVDSSWPWP